MYGNFLEVSVRKWSGAVAVIAFALSFGVPFAAIAVTATQTYIGTIISANDGGSSNNSCDESVDNTQQDLNGAVSAVDGCAQTQFSNQICGENAQGLGVAHCTVNNFQLPPVTPDGGNTYQWTAHLVPNGGSGCVADCDSVVHLSVNYTCPNGGGTNSQYPGWCIVNGPPPTQKCQQKAGQSAGYWSMYENQTSAVDSDGCQVNFTGSVMCTTVTSGFVEPNCVSEGSYPGSTAPSGATNPPGDSNNSTANCGSGSSGTVCMGSGSAPGCGTVDGVPFCPTDIPPNSCTSTPSGGSFCESDAGTSPSSPPAPDNGTANVPAAPTASISVGSVGAAANGTAPSITYFSPSVVAASSPGGSQPIGTTTGQGATSAPALGTNSQSTQVASDIHAIRSAVSNIAAQAAATVAVPSIGTGTGAADADAGSVSGDSDAAGINSQTESVPFTFATRTCAPYTWTLESVSFTWNFCNVAGWINSALFWFFYALTAWYLWVSWQRSGIGRTD